MSQTWILRTQRQARDLWDALKRWPEFAESNPLAVTVQHAKDKRTLKQNDKYRGMLRDIAAQARDGKFSPEQWHLTFATTFLGTVDIDLPDGRVISQPISTASLDIDQFSKYIDEISAHARVVEKVIFTEDI